jgi:hypothetical protein
MARPSIEEGVRKAVREYLLLAENLSAEEAPLNTLAVAARLNFDRKTLKKYHLDEDIAAASQRQASRGKPSPKEIEQRSIQNRLRARDEEIVSMRLRCEALIERACLAEGNAQRLGVDPAELWKPLPLSNRSLPHTGGRRRKRRA